MNRSILLCGLTTALVVVFWIAGPSPAKAWPPYPIEPYPVDEYPSCCVDFNQLQGQSCPTGTRVACNWGYYGPGYCECYYGTTWECYSSRSIPANPDQPICD